MVPGIGPATAEKILLTRKWYGAFKSVDDCRHRGIGKKRLEKVRKYLIVGRPAVASKPSPGKAAAVDRPANPSRRARSVASSATDASLLVKSIMKSTPSSEKPADTPATLNPTKNHSSDS
jgi:Helix-hairpin-helix motif